ncbi:MAG: U-box domain-containing protein [Gammaproteobacteria bacterium]
MIHPTIISKEKINEIQHIIGKHSITPWAFSLIGQGYTDAINKMMKEMKEALTNYSKQAPTLAVKLKSTDEIDLLGKTLLSICSIYVNGKNTLYALNSSPIHSDWQTYQTEGKRLDTVFSHLTTLLRHALVDAVSKQIIPFENLTADLTKYVSQADESPHVKNEFHTWLWKLIDAIHIKQTLATFKPVNKNIKLFNHLLKINMAEFCLKKIEIPALPSAKEKQQKRADGLEGFAQSYGGSINSSENSIKKQIAAHDKMDVAYRALKREMRSWKDETPNYQLPSQLQSLLEEFTAELTAKVPFNVEEEIKKIYGDYYDFEKLVVRNETSDCRIIFSQVFPISHIQTTRTTRRQIAQQASSANIVAASVSSNSIPNLTINLTQTAVQEKKEQPEKIQSEETLVSLEEAQRKYDELPEKYQMALDENHDINCSITRVVSFDPVTVSSGKTYDRFGITNWLAIDKTDPLTRESLANTRFISNNEQRKKVVEQVDLVYAQYLQEKAAESKQESSEKVHDTVSTTNDNCVEHIEANIANKAVDDSAVDTTTISADPYERTWPEIPAYAPSAPNIPGTTAFSQRATVPKRDTGDAEKFSPQLAS